MVIFNRLWQSVRSDADPTLVHQLDCQFQLMKAIHINYKGFYKLTIGELLKAMQSQIDDQMAKLATTSTPLCQNSLTLQVSGKVDKHCFVDANFARNRADQAKEATLELVLGWLGFQNFFKASHQPPMITLNFRSECHFPNPPPRLP